MISTSRSTTLQKTSESFVIALSFDYVVLGGGSGGLASARRAAQYGAKVALVEAADLGGTCVNVGCVPKKITWNAAQLAGALVDSADYHFTTSWSLDYPAFQAHRSAYVAKLREIYRRNLERDGVTLVAGFGSLAGAREVAVRAGDGTE